MQEQVLNIIRKKKLTVKFFLHFNTILEGQIISFDKDTILILEGVEQSLIYKNSILYIQKPKGEEWLEK